MARKATAKKEPEPEAVPKQETTSTIARCCASCAYWKPRPNCGFIGECMPSKNGLGQPLVTTDWTSCSNHDYADQWK